MRRCSVILLALAAVGCEPVNAARLSRAAARDTTPRTRADTSARPAAAEPARRPAPADSLRRVDSSVVRGLYVLRWASQSPAKMRRLIEIADSTEVNALVIDMKDEFGLNFRSDDTLVARNAGRAGVVANLEALLDTLEAHGVRSIARVVVFKDSVAARLNPQHTIRKADGGAWRDKEGLTWVSAYDAAIWEYNIRVAEELVRKGFKEIQFDYIRFPEPYPSLPKQVFPTANGRSKQQALAEFLRAACPRIRALGATCTIDVFGLVTTVPTALEIGQQWESLSPLVDVVLPMAYPSHYPRGSFGFPRPNAEPYGVQLAAIRKARERDRKLGIAEPEHVRPWIQAFSLPRLLPKYGTAEIAAQKKAIYEAGYEGWILWNPGSRYEGFLPALEKTAEMRSKKVN